MSARSIVSRAALLLLVLVAPPASGQMRWTNTSPFSERGATRVAAGDLNQDGLVDAALLLGTGVSLLLGDGRGSFALATRVPVVATGEILMADFNLDGNDDVVVANVRTVVVVWSDGIGGVLMQATVALANNTSDIDVADMDGDGFPDIVAALQSGIQILYGAPAGFPRSLIVAPGVATNAVSLADMNGDAVPDLLSIDSSNIQVRLAGPGATYPLALTFYAGGFYSPRLLALDVDGDGQPEITHYSQLERGGSVYRLFRGTVAGGFRLYFETGGNGNPTPSFADLDQDGRLDMVLGGRLSCFTLFATPSGEFVIGATANTGGQTVVVADADSDGFPDVISPERVALNRCHEARRGTVDAGNGREPIDVLMVNGLPGDGRARTLTVSRRVPFSVTIGAPPSKGLGPAPFCLYGWIAAPNAWDPAPLSSPVPLSLASPLTGGSPQPALVWNNFPGTRAAQLGTADRFSLPAPSVVVDRPSGLPRAGSFFLQGIIRDSQSPNQIAAATNAIQVIVQ